MGSQGFIVYEIIIAERGPVENPLCQSLKCPKALSSNPTKVLYQYWGVMSSIMVYYFLYYPLPFIVPLGGGEGFRV